MDETGDKAKVIRGLILAVSTYWPYVKSVKKSWTIWSIKCGSVEKKNVKFMSWLSGKSRCNFVVSNQF